MCDNKQREFPRLAPPQGWQAGSLWKDTGPGHDSESATSSAAKCRSPTAGIASWQAPPAAAYLEGHAILRVYPGRAGRWHTRRAARAATVIRRGNWTMARGRAAHSGWHDRATSGCQTAGRQLPAGRKCQLERCVQVVARTPARTPALAFKLPVTGLAGPRSESCAHPRFVRLQGPPGRGLAPGVPDLNRGPDLQKKMGDPAGPVAARIMAGGLRPAPGAADFPLPR